MYIIIFVFGFYYLPFLVLGGYGLSNPFLNPFLKIIHRGTFPNSKKYKTKTRTDTNYQTPFMLWKKYYFELLL